MTTLLQIFKKALGWVFPFITTSAIPFLKKNWQAVLLIVVVVIGSAMFRRSREGVAETLGKMQAAHDAQLKQLSDIREAERLEHEANLKKMQDTLAAVQKEYEAQKQVFEEKKAAQIVAIVNKYKGDPTGLTKKLSEVTGFQIIVAGSNGK